MPCRGIHLYNSSDILRYLYGAFLPRDPKMVEFLKPTKEAVELEAKIDQFALDCRRWDFIFCIEREIASCVFFKKNRWFYYHTLVESPLGGDECALKIWGYYSDRVPKWQKVVLKV